MRLEDGSGHICRRQQRCHLLPLFTAAAAAHSVTAAASTQYKLFISCATDSSLQGQMTSYRILKGGTPSIFGWNSRHLLLWSLCVSVLVLSCTGTCGHGACCKAWCVLSRRMTHDARTSLDWCSTCLPSQNPQCRRNGAVGPFAPRRRLGRQAVVLLGLQAGSVAPQGRAT